MSEERQRFALEGLGVGTWHWDIGQDRLTCSERCRQLLGLPPDAVMTRDELYERIHPDDRLATRSATELAMADDTIYESEYRILWDDGSAHWIAARGRGYHDALAHPTRFEGTVQNIDGRKAAESTVREAAERQQRFMQDVLASVTGGRLIFCQAASDLPEPLDAAAGPIRLTMDGGLRELRWAAREACEAAGLPDECRYDLETAVGEAAMNAVVHVGEGCGRVFVNGESGTVQVRIDDEGPGISLENLPNATLQKGFTTAGTLGHGMKMMIQQADRVFLLTGPAGTTVVIEQERVKAPQTW